MSALNAKMRENSVPSSINPDGQLEEDIKEVAEELINMEGEKHRQFEVFSSTIFVCIQE